MRRGNHTGSYWHRFLAYAAYHGWPGTELVGIRPCVLFVPAGGSWLKWLAPRSAPGVWSWVDPFNRAVLQRPGSAESPVPSYRDIEPRPK